MGGGEEPDLSAVDLRRQVKELARQICEQDLEALAKALPQQLASDATLCWRFLRLRDKAVAHLRRVDGKAFNDYEFNNVYSRFYIAARNALSGSLPPAARGLEQADKPESEAAFAACYRKMQGELVEKKMSPLPWTLRSLAELQATAAGEGEEDAEPKGTEEVLAKLCIAEDESSFTYRSEVGASELTLAVPLTVRAKLRERA